VVAEVAASIAAAVQRFEAAAPPDPLARFEHVYAERPPHLVRQREQLAAWLRDGHDAAPAPDTAVHPSPPMRGQRSTHR
jgi:hypothetical protein